MKVSPRVQFLNLYFYPYIMALIPFNTINAHDFQSYVFSTDFSPLVKFLILNILPYVSTWKSNTDLRFIISITNPNIFCLKPAPPTGFPISFNGDSIFLVAQIKHTCSHLEFLSFPTSNMSTNLLRYSLFFCQYLQDIFGILLLLTIPSAVILIWAKLPSLLPLYHCNDPLTGPPASVQVLQAIPHTKARGSC